MRSRRILLASALCLALLANSGCIVRSINPWFGKLDVTFENDLLGGWVGPEQGTHLAMTFVHGQGDTYLVQYSNDDGHGIFQGTLARIAGEYYMDFRPVEGPNSADGVLLFPTHSVARLEFGRDKLSVYLLQYDTVKAAAQKDKLKETKFMWDDENELLLTAPPEDLKAFLVLHHRDQDWFKPPLQLVRK
ncbi:MAG: hypothetical protein HY046_02830 [Acidobacteria bacterium]|nr:hypothetical protein [Acidobacteriota bacterium]